VAGILALAGSVKHKISSGRLGGQPENVCISKVRGIQVALTRQSLLETLELANGKTTPETLESQLFQVKDALSNLLNFFKPPSDDSAKAVAKDLVDGVALQPGELVIIQRLSKDLVLDQLQWFVSLATHKRG